MNKKPYYQNFYKLQMAMLNNNENVLIFGPAASGKCDAMERCIEEYGKDKNIVIFTRKTALHLKAYQYTNTTCMNWEIKDGQINPSWIKDDFDILLIDGFCQNWKQLVEAYKDKKIIMSIRADKNGDIPTDVKQHFRIVAKCGFVDQDCKTKGITSVRIFKG